MANENDDDDLIELSRCHYCRKHVPVANLETHMLRCPSRPSSSQQQRSTTSSASFVSIPSAEPDGRARSTQQRRRVRAASRRSPATGSGSSQLPSVSSAYATARSDMAECSRCGQTLPKTEVEDHMLAHRLEEQSFMTGSGPSRMRSREISSEGNSSRRSTSFSGPPRTSGSRRVPTDGTSVASMRTAGQSSNSRRRSRETSTESGDPSSGVRMEFSFGYGPQGIFWGSDAPATMRESDCSRGVFRRTSSGRGRNSLAEIRDIMISPPSDFDFEDNPIFMLLNRMSGEDHLLPFFGLRGLDYEAMMDLHEQLNPPRGVDEQVLESLPTGNFDSSRKEQLNEESRQCLICLEEFTEGDEQRWLPCLHTFHTPCIDRWLQASTQCPICKVDIEAHS